jgi:hypothetical protein
LKVHYWGGPLYAEDFHTHDKMDKKLRHFLVTPHESLGHRLGLFGGSGAFKGRGLVTGSEVTGDVAEGEIDGCTA